MLKYKVNQIVKLTEKYIRTLSDGFVKNNNVKIESLCKYGYVATFDGALYYFDERWLEPIENNDLEKVCKLK